MPGVAALLEGAWFAGLPDVFRAAIMRHSRLMRLATGAMLFMRGDPPDGLYAIVEGRVEFGAVDEDGQPATLTVAEAATWFGEIAVFDARPRTHDAVMLAPTTLLHVPQEALLAFLRQEPTCWRDLALLLTSKLRLSFTILEAATLLPATQRLAARLLMMSEGYDGASRPQTEIKLPQERLAAMLNLSRQTVNHSLKALERQGLITVKAGCITLLDEAGLRRASGR